MCDVPPTPRSAISFQCNVRKVSVDPRTGLRAVPTYLFIALLRVERSIALLALPQVLVSQGVGAVLTSPKNREMVRSVIAFP